MSLEWNVNLTEEVSVPAFCTLVHVENVGQANDCGGATNSCESKESNDQTFLAKGYLQVFDDPERQKTKCPVGNNVKTRNRED